MLLSEKFSKIKATNKTIRKQDHEITPAKAGTAVREGMERERTSTFILYKNTV